MTVSGASVDRISLLYGIAKSHGSLISIRELATLLPDSSSVEDLAEAIASTPTLSSRFQLRGGYVIERSERQGPALKAESESRERARRNLSFAAKYAPMLHGTPLRVVAVSGSTSYNSAAKSTDVDVFCISKTGKMWLSVAQAMVMSRVFRLLNRESPEICLSCFMDESYARVAYSTEQGPLFARDALATRVIRGSPAYNSLIHSATWMRAHFPSVYESRTGNGGGNSELSAPVSTFSSVLNEILFRLVGGYLGLKARLLNRRFARQSRKGDRFVVRAGPDHMFYESNRYTELRMKYSASNGDPQATESAQSASPPRTA